MYEVDEKDEVLELKGVPWPNGGAPEPIVLASEYDILLAYELLERPEEWDDADSEKEAVAIVKFDFCDAHMFGPPNDEAFSGHPLYERGLQYYSLAEIRHSSWIRKLERMNSVHPNHDKTRFFEGLKHYIFAFHDSTFECIAKGFEIEVYEGSVKNMIPRMAENIR